MQQRSTQAIDKTRFLSHFFGMLGRNAECYADVVLPKLS